jgi:hypothetical protein
VETKYYKFLKLTNGEDIIAATNNDCKNFKDQKMVLVSDPVLIGTIKMAQGPYLVETYTMQPWIKIAKEDIIEIPTESIVVAVDIDDKVVTQYQGFLEEYNSTSPDLSQMDESELEDLYDTIESEEELNEIVNEVKKERLLH